MDFVVVGLGLGALAILAGVALLGWRLPRAGRAVARAETPSAVARAEAAAATVRGAGLLSLASGGLLLLATAGALLGSLDDRTGAFAIATTATIVALGILVWGFQNRAFIPWLTPQRRPRGRQPATLERASPRPATTPHAAARPAAGETAADTDADVDASWNDPLAWDEAADNGVDPEHAVLLAHDDAGADAVLAIVAMPQPDEEAGAVVAAAVTRRNPDDGP